MSGLSPYSRTAAYRQILSRLARRLPIPRIDISDLGDYSSLLVALEPSCVGDFAIRAAVEIAASARGRLTLLATYTRARPLVPSVPGSYVALTAIARSFPSEAELIVAARSRLEIGLGQVGDAVPAAGVIREGPLTRALVKRALAADHDLIVIGATAGLRRLHARALASRVAERARVDVLVVSEGAAHLVAAPKATNTPA